MPRFLSPVQAIGTSASSLTPVTIGTDTTTVQSGAYFGSDTPLYRKAANVLACNRLDQTVAPVESFSMNNDPVGVLLNPSANASYNISSFTMPWAGDLIIHGSIYLANTAVGTAVSASALVSSSGTLDQHPEAVWRCEVASGQFIFTPFMLARYTAVAAGTVTISVALRNIGTVQLSINRLSATIIAIRK